MLVLPINTLNLAKKTFLHKHKKFSKVYFSDKKKFVKIVRVRFLKYR